MSEMDLTRQDDQADATNMFNRLSPAQQIQFLQSIQNQQQLLPYQHNSEGSNFGNIISNLGRRIKVKYGIDPDPQGVLANQKYLMNEAQMSLLERQQNREINFRSSMLNLGVKPDIANNASIDVLEDILKQTQSAPFYGPGGNVFTKNNYTNEITKVTDLPTEIQEFIFDKNYTSKGPELNEAQSALISGEKNLEVPEGFSRTRISNQQNNEEEEIFGPFESKRRRELLGKVDEKNLATIDGFKKTYRENSYGAAEQLKRLQDMELLLTPFFDKNGVLIDGARTGGGQEMLTAIQSFGYNFNLTDKDPTREQVFNGFATGFILPLAKSLGQNPTDRDMVLIGSASADLNKTPEGNLILIKTKMIEEARKNLVYQAWLDYSEENANDSIYKTTQFLNGWNRKLYEIQQSPEFMGADVLKLRSQARSILNKTPDVPSVLRSLSTDGG